MLGIMSTRRRKIMAVAAVLLLMLLVAWLTLLNQSVTFAHGYLLGQHGHYGGFHADQFSVLCVTNRDSATIHLDGQIVQWEQGGRVVNDMAAKWNGDKGQIAVSSQEAAFLPFEVPTTAERFRVTFSYSWSGGRPLDVLSRGVRRLPLNSLPTGLRGWLFKHGLLDGSHHRQFELPWMTNQSAAADRRPAGQADGSDIFTATLAAGRAFPAAVAELGRWVRFEHDAASAAELNVRPLRTSQHTP
jgi:hypothetical protein